MRRPFFLTRRLSHRRHPRYHHSHTRRGARKQRLRQRLTYKKRQVRGGSGARGGGRARGGSGARARGGGIGETVGTMNGMPVSKEALVTNSRGVTRSVSEISPIMDVAETDALMGDDDV